MTRNELLRVFKEFRALSWVARQLRVNKGTLWRWLNEDRPSTARLAPRKDRVESLARKILETNGECVRRVNGLSVRSQIRRLRRRK